MHRVSVPLSRRSRALSSVSIRGKSSLEGQLRGGQSVTMDTRPRVRTRVRARERVCVLPADGLLNEPHPGVPVVLGGSVQLIHLWGGGVADEEHPPLLIGYVSHYQVLEGQHGGLVL